MSAFPVRDWAVRRIRQVPYSVSQAAIARLSVAVVLSATLHLYLIYGVALQPSRGPADHPSIINAQLLPERAAVKPAALAVPATERARVPRARSQVAPLREPDQALEFIPQTPSTGDPGPEPEVASASLPDPVHYAAKELDVYPQPLNRIEPAYPLTARDSEIGGFVTLLILIDESGRVTDISVVDASPPDVFEESARQAVAARVYSPAQRNGRAVRSRLLVKVDYDPAASGVEE